MTSNLDGQPAGGNVSVARVVVAGCPGAGKTTFINAISDAGVGQLVVGQDLVIGFYETPAGQTFHGLGIIQPPSLLGVVVVVDSHDLTTFSQARSIVGCLHTDRPAPLVVAANKQDGNGSLSPGKLRALLAVPSAVPVIACVALHRASVHAVLIHLMYQALAKNDSDSS